MLEVKENTLKNAKAIMDLSVMVGLNYTAANALVAKFGLGGITQQDEASLMSVKGIGKMRAKKIIAFSKLHNAVLLSSTPFPKKITDAVEVYKYMLPLMGNLEKEEFHVFLLGGRNEVLEVVKISDGRRDSCQVHSSDIFRAALVRRACSVILVHNHPSGDPSPSPEDCAMTRKVLAGGNLIGISVLDHVIIGKAGYTSLREEGLIG